MNIRHATTDDLEVINTTVEQAVMSWDLSERVKRLTLESYWYKPEDFQQFKFLVVVEDEQIIAVAATEKADKKDLPEAINALLLHGLYVEKSQQRKSVGKALFEYVCSDALQNKYDAVLVKAQKGAEGFFIKQGMKKIDPATTRSGYAYSYLVCLD